MESISAEAPPVAAAPDEASWGHDLRRALRGVPAAAKVHLWRPALLICLPLGLIVGLFVGWSLKAWIGLTVSGQPYPLIAGSIVLNLLLLSSLLMWLPREHASWQFIFTWIAWSLAAVTAYTGLWLSGTESLQTFAVLWLLTIGQGALLGAIYSVAAVLFSGRMLVARQVAMLILALAVTAIFWSKTPIQSAEKDENDRGLPMGDLLYDASLKFSPPLAVCAAWYQESDASRGAIHGDNARFDVIRGPLSYSIWMGSYQIIPYPDILPVKPPQIGNSAEPQGISGWLEIFIGKDAGKDGTKLGLALTTVIWGVPVMMLADLLLILLFMRRAPKHAQ